MRQCQVRYETSQMLLSLDRVYSKQHMYRRGIETHVTLAKVWVRDPLEDLRRLHERIFEFGDDADLAYKSHEIPEFRESIE